MYKIKPFSVSRSHTKQQLPSINNKIVRSGAYISNKSYLGDISQQISGNAEYDEMDHSNLTKQQRKLKDILRKMNDDTVRIIADYTPRAKKVQHHHRTATSILAVKDRELENNGKIMSQCEIQIEKLKERYEGLNAGGKELYQQEIARLQNQVMLAQEENRGLRVENQRRGKSIVNQNRIIEEGEIRKIETDVYLAEHRASHLRSDDYRVEEEIKEYEKKLKEIAARWVEAEKFMKEEQKKMKQKDSLRSNEYELMHRKTMLQNNRKKAQFYNQNYQYKYLNLLKQLDTTSTSAKQTQAKIDKHFVSIEASKMIVAKLESQLRSIKIKKKERQEHINQFLSKTKNNNEQKNASRILNQEEGRLLSEISKQEPPADNSQIDLEQAMVGFIDKQVKEPGVQSRIKSQKKQQPQRQDVLLNQQ